MKKKPKNSIFYCRSDISREFLKIKNILLIIMLAIYMPGMMVYAQSPENILSLKLTNAPLNQIFQEIEHNSQYVFVYETGLLDQNVRKSVNANGNTIDIVLDQLFSGTDIRYKIEDRQVLLYKKKYRFTKNPFPKESIPQPVEKEITGKVTGKAGEPLVGVTILLKGTQTGTITNLEGEYALMVPEDAKTLVFSFVGLKTVEIPIEDKVKIDVIMEEDLIGLEEIVAIGYGTVKKSDLTGSLTSISSKQFEDQPMTELSQLLRGRGAGIEVISTSGALGDPSRIRIRGANSISGSNDPLYIVDGFVSTVYNIHDIESVEILKDASATAIYGSRGANGVILITTRGRQREVKPTVTITSNTQMGHIPNKYDLLSPAEFAREVNEIYSTAPPFSSADISAFESGTKGTDWQEEIFQSSLSQDYNIRLDGGTEKSSFYASIGVRDQTGLLKNTKANDYNFSGKIQTKVNDRLDILFKVGLQRNSVLNNTKGTTGQRLTPVYQSLIWAPTTPIYQDDGFYTMNDDHGSINVDVNPVRDVLEPDATNYYQMGTLNADIKYKILKDLTVDFMGTFRQVSTEGRTYTNIYISRDGADAVRRNINDVNWQFTTLLNYNKTLASDHNLGATAGYEMLSDESYNFSATATNLSIESVGYNNLSLGATKDISSGFTESSLLSYFGRLNYNYKEKYYLTATYRADGSSKFRGDNQFSYFPSAAISWRASNEDFIRDLDLFDMLKLRVSWGITGNQAITPYATLASLRSRYYMWGPYSTTRYYGYAPANPANPDLKWEETSQLNIGVDMGLLDNRLGITLDYFNKITSDLLLPDLLPGYSGNGKGASVISNLGEVQNTGFEAGITFVPVLQKDLVWEINLNTYILKNEVLDLGDNDQLLGYDWLGGNLVTHNTVVGEPLGSFYGYTYLGVWKTSEAAEAANYGRSPGDAKYLDVDNNYSYGEDDLQIIGNSLPDFTWNLNNLITYKNFDVNVLIAGSHGAEIINLSYAAAALPEYDSKTITLREAYENRWTTSNENTTFTGINSINNLRNSTQWLQDGSFVKLRNLSVAYNLPKSLIKIGDLKLTVSGQNLVTITDYKGFDPELSATNGNADRDFGVDSGIIPPPRTYSFGVSLTF